MKHIAQALRDIEQKGNLRSIPVTDADAKLTDLSSNDYLGIAEDREFIESFFESLAPADFIPTASASRLLAGRQSEYRELETELENCYGRPALLFNSGYHANTGIIKALADKSTLFIADKLVHASIIDGLNLAAASGATFVRFRHNDFSHLEKLMEKHGPDYRRVVIVAESVYSMDGDSTDLNELARIKEMHPGAMVYLDEAHSVGVTGPSGLGMAKGHAQFDKIDIIIGTFGKALASAGAYAIVSPVLKEYLINTARSLIFSTALPPLTVRWSLATLRYSLAHDDRRKHLDVLAHELSSILGSEIPSHIQPFIVGSPEKALSASRLFAEAGYRVLAIRTPTVLAGTDRLRFSLSAALSAEDLSGISEVIGKMRAVR